MSERAIRILLVDDHTVVRAGIRALLSEVDDMQVVGEAANGNDAVELAETLRPDVILMDLVMPDVDGIYAIQKIHEQLPDIKMLALTSFSSDDKVFPAIKAGALGYLLKDTTPRDLIAAIRKVHSGESSLHPAIARKVLLELRQSNRRKESAQTLTERETDVLELLARGCSNQEIADYLCVSGTTVRSHVSNILSKLHLSNRVQAALYALKEGIVGAEEAQ